VKRCGLLTLLHNKNKGRKIKIMGVGIESKNRGKEIGVGNL